jgi:hypothetical protein
MLKKTRLRPVPIRVWRLPLQRGPRRINPSDASAAHAAQKRIAARCVPLNRAKGVRLRGILTADHFRNPEFSSDYAQVLILSFG